MVPVLQACIKLLSFPNEKTARACALAVLNAAEAG
jgi:hypothetical protein